MSYELRSLTLDLYRFTRFSAFGATAVLPLLGAGSVAPKLSRPQALGLLGVAAAFHVFAYVDNDLCDLELDRTQPLRAAYPLVRGAITPQAARAIALACVPLGFVLNEQLVRKVPEAASEEQGRAYLAVAFALLAAYNRWGKRCPVPPLTDLVQAMGWAALLLYGATATGRQPVPLTHALVGYELLLVAMVNGVHGALRDLDNDAARGARTTAIALGAQANHGRLQISPALGAYALLLQAALLGLPLWAAVRHGGAQAAPERAAAVAGASATALGTLALLGAAARGGPTPTAVGMLHLVLLLSAPLAVVAPRMAVAPRSVLLVAHGVPLLANGLTYDGLRWLLRVAFHAISQTAPQSHKAHRDRNWLC